MGAFSLTIDVLFHHWNIYNRLVIVCIVKTAAEVKRLCFTSEKASLSSGFFGSNRLCLSSCAATNSKRQRLKRVA